MCSLRFPKKALIDFELLSLSFTSSMTYGTHAMFKQLELVFARLLHTHYCVHVHPNNWEIAKPKHGLEVPVNMEFTFYRKDRIRKIELVKNFPHPLDRENFVGHRKITLADTGLFPRLTNQQ